MADAAQDENTKDPINELKTKKEKVLQPLGNISDNVPKLNIHGADEQLLAELRERTAKLAEQVHGKEDPIKHELKIDDPSVHDEDVIDALKEDSQDRPKSDNNDKSSANPAVELVRLKLEKLYKKEPEAAEEAIESYEAGRHRSKHQRYMYELTTSGKSLAEIQTDWHNYYTQLPDDEKHQVWAEFYESQSQHPEYNPLTPRHDNIPARKKSRIHIPPVTMHEQSTTQSVADLKKQIYRKVERRSKPRLSFGQHLRSLLFGLSMAALVGLIITFTFFNEVFIAPFISPSRNVSATPIIGSVEGDVGPEPKIIIPKINLEVPVVFDMLSTNEKDIQNSLEDGVVHYATTPYPGEQGNSVVVGHSSNNILNSGKYKFAFVLLKRLEADDTFFVQKDGIRYTYKVYKKEIVSPDNTDVLQTQDKPNTITLITCDPPGTSINRLIIVGEQISPDPSGNTASTAQPLDTDNINVLPSNAPSLWSRIWPF